MSATTLRTALASGLALLALATGCASSSDSAPSASAADTASPLAPFTDLVDDCLAVGIGAAASRAYQDSPLQHLYGLSVDGQLWQSNLLTITVTTGNDEDGDTTRKVTVDEEIDYDTGKTTCTVKTIDGKTAPPISDGPQAYAAIVDPCTQRAVQEANKISDNYWHLEDLTVDGDLADDGVVKYTVTAGNDEDGDTTYDVAVTQTFDRTNGGVTCTTRGAVEEPRN